MAPARAASTSGGDFDIWDIHMVNRDSGEITVLSEWLAGWGLPVTTWKMHSFKATIRPGQAIVSSSPSRRERWSECKRHIQWDPVVQSTFQPTTEVIRRPATNENDGHVFDKGVLS